MSDTPTDPNTQNAQPHPVENFAESLQLFWLKNRNAIVLGCVIVLLGIIGRGAWAFYVEQREVSIAKDYSACGTSLEKLKQFASANEGHALASVAMLQLADESYAAGKYAEALGYYEKVATSLKGTSFVSRAVLGVAMSQLMAGKSTEAQAALRRIADDTAQFKGLRAEAAYHLVTVLIEGGKGEEAKKLIDQLLQIDASGVWAQRAMLLRASLMGPAANAPKQGLSIGVPAK